MRHHGRPYQHHPAGLARTCVPACSCCSPLLLQFIFPNAMGHPVTALVKTFLDQAIMAPAGISLFFTAMGMLEGKSSAQVRAHTQDTQHARTHTCMQTGVPARALMAWGLGRSCLVAAAVLPPTAFGCLTLQSSGRLLCCCLCSLEPCPARAACRLSCRLWLR